MRLAPLTGAEDHRIRVHRNSVVAFSGKRVLTEGRRSFFEYANNEYANNEHEHGKHAIGFFRYAGFSFQYGKPGCCMVDARRPSAAERDFFQH